MIIFAAALFCLTGYSKGKYNDVKIVMDNLIKAEESFIVSVDAEKSSEDVIKAFNALSSALAILKPQMIELEKKYPELKDEKNTSPELKKVMEKFESINSKVIQTFQVISAKYAGDEKVQNACHELQKAMAKDQTAPDGVSKERYSDVKVALETLIKAEESFITASEKAESAQDIIKAVNALAEIMLKLKPQMVELEKKYPELKNDTNIPSELKELKEKFEVMNVKFAQVMGTVMTKFGSDEKVQKAFQEMISKMQ